MKGLFAAFGDPENSITNQFWIGTTQTCGNGHIFQVTAETSVNPPIAFEPIVLIHCPVLDCNGMVILDIDGKVSARLPDKNSPKSR